MSANAQSHLLHTKLRRPHAPGDLVRRGRLVERLNRGIDRPLILVSAPAGFGKTTLLSSWLETCPWPSAWLALDESDSAPDVFLAYFLAAIRSIFSDIGKQIPSLPGTTGFAWVQAVAAGLRDDLERVGQPFVLVLDDYHAIREPAIHNLLGELLRHPLPCTHLVLITRQDPPLPLSDLRGHDQVTEIRGGDLRFRTPEIASFLQQALGSLPGAWELAVLEQKTEGWAAGVRLAALSFGDRDQMNARLADLNADNRYVMDYLLSEVLLRQTPAVQEFLLWTSIPDRLCTSLCDAVAGQGEDACDGRTCLEWLEQSDLFMVALDEQRQWFRYHHLFRLLLQSELERRYSLDAVAAGHARASAWFAEQGLIEEALHHAVAGGDTATVVELVACHRQTLMNQEAWPRLESWLHLLPPAVIAEQPELLIAQAWCALLQGQLVADLPGLERAEALLATLPQEASLGILLAEIAALRSLLASYAADGPGAITYARQALEITPRERSMVRLLARLMLAGGYRLIGDLEAAYATLDESSLPLDTGRAAYRLPEGRCLVAWAAGDLSAVSGAATRLIEILNTQGWGGSTEWAHAWQGAVHYQQNELAEAERHFELALTQEHVMSAVCFAQSAYGLALTYQAQGKSATARSIIESTMAFMIDSRYVALMQEVESFQAELAILQGDGAAALRWAETASLRLPPSAMGLPYDPQLTLPKALLHHNTPGTRRQAAEILRDLEHFLTATHNTRFLIEVLAMRAMLLDAEGDEPAALAALERAVDLAQPGGFVRLFVDLGPQLARLLARLRAQSSTLVYVDQILSACPAAMAAEPAGQARSIEPLTERELEILGLLAQRRSNKEIAQLIVISVQTVKRHTLNIYRKLQVDSRWDAVSKAAALGILPN